MGIYLDYAAHTPADPAVLQAFCAAECLGNPSSKHGAGRQAAQVMEQAVQSAARLLGILPEEVIFTSGASEANNLALKGFARTLRHAGKHMITTPLEHPSVSGTLTALQEQGYEVDLVRIGQDGKVDLDHLRELIRRDTVLVTVCAVDSELGVIQPIREIAEITAAFEQCRFHTDATQAIGKIELDLHTADCASISAHKFFGICGSGILYKRQDLVLEPLIHGGQSTTLYRSGTPAVSLAASTAEALRLANLRRNTAQAQLTAHNKRLREALSAYPRVRINSPAQAIAHILNLSVHGVSGTDFQQLLDAKGISVSVKSACSTANTPSRAVFAVTRDRKNARSAWRISLSHQTTEQDITGFLDCFHAIYKEL